MKLCLKLFSLVILFLSIQPGVVHAQVVADFEEFNLSVGEHLNDATPATTFPSGAIELPNTFDPEFNFWGGWSISADTNTTTPGFTNQFSAIPGKGALNSNTYAVGFNFDPITIHMQPQALGKPMIGLYITNSTYAYLSMRDGDPFAKKFGGETGDDPDFLMITFKKYQGGVLSADSIDVFLADYRFSDNNMDYLVSDWLYVDLTGLGPMDSLSMRMTSSDNGIFGMNTPAYVCVDRVTTDNLQDAYAANEINPGFSFAPNPASEILMVEMHSDSPLTILDMQGKIMYSEFLPSGTHQVGVSDWPKGAYLIRLKGGLAQRICVQ